jgi:hypothetical protein
MRIAVVFTAFALLSCTDALGPLRDGQPYNLRTINGQSLPWTSPVGSGGYIAGGWVKIDNGSLAERHEETNTSSWTSTGTYKLTIGMLIIDYGTGWQLGGLGPLQRADTFRVSGNELVLREGAFIAPNDSMVRRYARP